MVIMMNKIKKTFYRLYHKILIPFRRIKGKLLIHNKKVTIISNNCWGGNVYREYGLMNMSPTIGLFFFADEYIKFLNNLDFYLNAPLVLIDNHTSKYTEYFNDYGVDDKTIIGSIEDVEIVFLHYKSKDEVISKWNRRIKRIDMSNLLVKFNDQNLCTYNHLAQFDKLPFMKKICFTAKEYSEFKSTIQMIEYINETHVGNDTNIKKTNKYLNIKKYLNKMKG